MMSTKRFELPPIRNTTTMSCQTFSLPNAPDDVHVNDTIYCWDFDSGTAFWLPEREFSCGFFDSCYCPELKHDVEVAGVGVILAFIISAFLTILATVLCLLLTRTDGAFHPPPSASPSSSGSSFFPPPDQSSPPTLNRLDAFSRTRICRPAVVFLHSRCGLDVGLLAAVTSDLVRFLSDTQLITGIAITVSAVAGLHQRDGDDPMTVYHFDIAADLAWFSSATHLASLLVIRYEDDGDGDSDSTAKRNHGPGTRGFPHKLHLGIRLVLMLLFASLLLYASWVAGYECWDYDAACPAKCTLGRPKGGEPGRWLIVNWVLIFYGYARHMLGLSVTVRSFWLDHVRRFVVPSRPAGVREMMGCCWGRRALANLLKTILFWVWNVLSSDIFDVTELLLWFVLGCYGIIDTRKDGHAVMSETEARAEDRIGFGQLVPIVLLLASPLAVVESYARNSRQQRKEEMRELDCRCGGCGWHGC
ncbi:hypothetical protein QBC42DRAFT_210917, partial [Cladorrhinum samala]